MRNYEYKAVWVPWDHKTTPVEFLTKRLNELTANGARVTIVNPAHHMFGNNLKLDGWDVILEVKH